MAITPLCDQPQAAKTCAQHEQLKKTSRRVMFNEASNVSYSNKAWTAEDCQRLWYTNLDYQQIKQATHSLAKQIYKCERKQQGNDSFSNVMIRVYDACCEATQEESLLNHNDQALLTKFVGKANTRAGLEKVYIRELNYDKKERRAHVVQTVCALQNKAHPTMVRVASESVTRASRLFAHCMATALADSMDC